MIINNKRLLVKKLNEYCFSLLERSIVFTSERGNYEVTWEHLFITIIDDDRGDIPVILDKFDMSIVDVKKGLLSSLDTYRTGNTGRPTFSAKLMDLFEHAWLLASVELGHTIIRSGHLLLAVLTQSENQLMYWTEDIWAALTKEKVMKVFYEGIDSSVEEIQKQEDTKRQLSESMDEFEKYTENITEKAKQGNIDPVFARENEIKQMIDILARRRKNNPILIGEPGTGKTAIVEGLALKIIEGNISPIFKNADIIKIDMGLLQAGASVKGEFENRLKNVIHSIKNYPKQVITFIDEAHMLIGAGGTAGQSDAANLLKPALARGELRVIAATTWKEYKKYFEKDDALTRRFQLIKINEPDDEAACTILRGLKSKYENFHNIRITDEAIQSAVKLSRRYITGRQLPDKSIDLIDTAAARVSLSQYATPSAIVQLIQDIETLSREKETLVVDRPTSNDQKSIDLRINEINTSIENLLNDQQSLSEKWESEKALASDYIKKFDQFSNSADKNKLEAEDELKKSYTSLKSFQKDDPMIFTEMNSDVLASVVSDWTGIPVGKMISGEVGDLLEMNKKLTKRIIGQDHALKTISDLLHVAKSGLNDPDKPMGIFFLAGPSGVGKTETALALADLLFGGERSLTTINMSEYQEKHNVSKLIGSPPGYVGFGEGGILTEAVRQKPYSVILLDEVEKAHKDVIEIFYQVFDKGVLSDGEGRITNFKNTVIILTTNMGSDEIYSIEKLNDNFSETEKYQKTMEKITPVLSAHFLPAFLSRLTVIPYYYLSKNTISTIVTLKLSKLKKRLESMGAEMVYHEDIIDWISSRCNTSESGARNIDHVINAQLLPKISLEMLSSIENKDHLKGRTLSLYVKNDEFGFNFSD